MFVPLHDDTTLNVIRFHYMSALIAVVNVAVLVYSNHVAAGEDAIFLSLGAIPALLTDQATIDPALILVPEPLTLLTYMFMHGGWLHLISNLLFLWVFADNVEDAFGHFGFLAFYLFCGVAAAGAHIVVWPDSQVPLVGASGAVAGVLGSYLVLFPKARVWILLFMRLPIRISAYWALLGWLGFQLAAVAVPQEEVQIALWAHIGGFAAGFAVTWVLRGPLRRRLAA
ncbi:MAG: rhomboid family intramembrane serine protease [Hyphomicrobiales bacterium]